MGKARYALLILKKIGFNKKYFVGITAVVAFALNYCFCQYTMLTWKTQAKTQLNYNNLYEVTFTEKVIDGDCWEWINTLQKKAGEDINVLTFNKKSLYTNVTEKDIAIVKTITKQESDKYGLSSACDQDNVFQAVVSYDLRKRYKSGNVYRIHLGRYIGETTQTVNIKIIGCSNGNYYISDNGDLNMLDNTILVCDPDHKIVYYKEKDTKPIISLLVDTNNDNTVLKKLEMEEGVIKIRALSEKEDRFLISDNKLIKSYRKIMIVIIGLYLIININMYVAFYYKEKECIRVLKICGVSKKYYVFGITFGSFLQAILGIVCGMCTWKTGVWLNGEYYISHWIETALIVFALHLLIVLFLSGGYKYIYENNY